MNKNYGMEIVRATEQAALTAAKYQGLGDSRLLLKMSRESALKYLDGLEMEAFMKNDRFYDDPEIPSFPQKLGLGGDRLDIMIASIEGHKSCAKGATNASSYISIAKENGFRSMPNLYMNKIAVGPKAQGVIDINEPANVNIKRVARALNKYIENITVCILDRARHTSLIAEVQSCGARIHLIQDGDISSSLATVMGKKVDILMGYGGAHEAVLTSAAMKCCGGYFEGKLYYKDDKDKEIARNSGIKNLDMVFTVEDLVLSNEVAFAATGITDGSFLEGVHFFSDGAETESFVTRGETKTFRNIKTRHYFDYKRIY